MNELRERHDDYQRRWVISAVWRRGHIHSPNENHISGKKEGKGEGSLVSGAPRRQLYSSRENELRERCGDYPRRRVISAVLRRGHIPSPNENHISPKKEGKGEGLLVSRAPRRQLYLLQVNDWRERRDDYQRRWVISAYGGEAMSGVDIFLPQMKTTFPARKKEREKVR